MKILYCIDMQIDFVTGILGSEYAQAIVPNVVKKVREHLESGNPVVFSRDTHFEDTYLETREGKHLSIPHCIHETEGWQLIPELMKICKEYEGKTFSFKEYDNLSLIRIGDKVDRFGMPMFDVSAEDVYAETSNGITVEFIGVATNMCVISSAITYQTFMTNTEITIDAACCASFDPVLHEKALDVMESLHMNIINR